ncbi:MAG TPA: DNA starvation/stationary phase protection protein Dps [Phycisphaerales bacterium]|nr:DNA starvation/stationary phase protection protein Dps [Phycisphaerales bacterium]
MHPTRNDLSPKTRSAVCDLFGDLLADAVDLQTQLKQAHWNVKGPTFIALHELFDTVAGEANGWIDVIAERIVQLGGTALGTARIAAKHSRLDEYPLKAVRSRDHVEAVAVALSTFGARVRAGIDAADKAGDKDAADICTEISLGVDKHLWFVESHSQRFA